MSCRAVTLSAVEGAVETCKATQVRYKGDFSIVDTLLMSKWPRIPSFWAKQRNNGQITDNEQPKKVHFATRMTPIHSNQLKQSI